MTNEEWAMEIQAGRAGYGELWEQVRRFIRLQAYKYQTLHAGLCERAGVELDDLLQCDFLALRDAVEAYDPERGYKLPTYIRYPLQNRFHDATGIRGNRKRDPLNLAVRLDAPIGDADGDATLGEQTADERAEADREAVPGAASPGHDKGPGYPGSHATGHHPKTVLEQRKPGYDCRQSRRIPRAGAAKRAKGVAKTASGFMCPADAALYRRNAGRVCLEGDWMDNFQADGCILRGEGGREDGNSDTAPTGKKKTKQGLLLRPAPHHCGRIRTAP